MLNKTLWQPQMLLPELELFSEAELDDLLHILDPSKPAPPANIVQPTPKGTKSKAGKIVSAALFYGFLLCLVGGAFLLSRGEKSDVFGYSFMNVITSSMQSVIPVGSLVVVRAVDTDTIRIGDDITFMKDAETAITHRVIGIIENYEGTGERGFETQGVDSDRPDFEIVRAANVVGVVKYHVPKLGQWLEWLRGNLVITFCFTAGILLLAVLLKGIFKKMPKNENKSGKKKKDSRQPTALLSAR